MQAKRRSSARAKSAAAVEQSHGGDAGIDAEFLWQVAQLAAVGLRIGKDVATVEAHLALVRLLQGGDGPHQGRLAGAVGTEEAEESVVDIEAHFLQRLDAVGIGLGKVIDVEHWGKSPGS